MMDEFSTPRERAEAYPTMRFYADSRTVEQLVTLLANEGYRGNAYGTYPGTVGEHLTDILASVAERATRPTPSVVAMMLDHLGDVADTNASHGLHTSADIIRDVARALSRLSALPVQEEVTDEMMKRATKAYHNAVISAPDETAGDRRQRVIRAALTAALTATDAKPLDDSSSCTKIWSIGNELHNIAIEHQTNEELAARLDKLACRLWEFRPATDAKPVVPAYPSKDELITSLLRQLQEARRCCTLCGASKWCEACQEVASLAPSPAVVPAEPVAGDDAWQPIETAPTGEKWKRPQLLLWNGERVRLGEWNADEYAKKPRPYWTYVGSMGKTDDRSSPPTHWMPLPSPPLASEGKTDAR